MMKTRTILASAFALSSIVIACDDDFDPKSAVTGVRVLGVKVDAPYSKPGTKTKLSMLVADGTPNRVVRSPKIVWFHGCTNPKGDTFFECYPDLSRRLGEAFQGREQPIDEEIPGLVTFGDTTVADVPADTLSARPQGVQGRVDQGRVFVFFAVCGGNVTYHPSPPNSSGLPIRCVNAQTNEDLDAQEFVYGYTPIFVFAQLANANPVIEGVELSGARPPPCSGQGCVPIVPRCTKDVEDDCPKVTFKPIVARSSVENDPVSTLLDAKPTNESLWVEYAALNGRFESGTRVVNDPSRGWQDGHEGKFTTFKAVQGEATLFAIVRDNRGGQAWVSFDVLVQ
jgi:hypothetical protein